MEREGWEGDQPYTHLSIRWFGELHPEMRSGLVVIIWSSSNRQGGAVQAALINY